MSTYDLEEQEQLASLKAWWKDNGGLITVILAVVLVAISAWNGWNWYQRSQSASAGAMYEQLQRAARTNDVKSVRDTAGAILEQYPRTAYAPLAALISAKVHFQSGDAKTARAQLEWAVARARSEDIKALASLRLAAVLLDDNALDEASRAVGGKAPTGFEALYYSMRGDILVAQKKIPDARSAYKAALDQGEKLDPSVREVVRLKLDALGDS